MGGSLITVTRLSLSKFLMHPLTFSFDDQIG
jgi:hypothetical protein